MPGEKAPLLSGIATGRVVGPRPGRAIVSFWQGIVEIVLRTAALVMLMVVLIPSIIALQKLADLGPVIYELKHIELAQAGCVLVIVVGVVGVAVEAVQIILRFINIGIINMTFRIFGYVDITIATVLSLLLLVGAILTGYAASLIVAVSQPLGATAGVCFLPILALIVQGVWMFLYVCFKWNKHVVTYTIKQTVFS